MDFDVLATTPSGQVPTAGELEAVFRTVGFDRLRRHDLPDSDEHVVVAWE